MSRLLQASLTLVLAVGLAASAAAQEPQAPLESASPPRAPKLEADANGRIPEEQVKQLLQLVIEKEGVNWKKRRDYTFVQHRRQDKLDGEGKVKSTETTTSEVLMVYGERVERLLAKNGKPLSEDETAKEEKRIQEIIDKRKNESEEKRTKRLAKEEKEREKGRNFVQEMADAYTFQMAGTELLEEGEAYVVDAEPRPGFKPRSKEARFLPKFRFRVWIDKDELQWAKLEAECIETVSFGLFLARVNKGSRVLLEQKRVNDEVWLPKHVAARVDARIALLKKYNLNEEYIYSDYKKFRTDTKIVGFGEAEPQGQPR
jgi:hypothetical protein